MIISIDGCGVQSQTGWTRYSALPRKWHSILDTNMVFTRPTPCKEARADSVSQSTLKHCADQLSSVFTDISNTPVVTCMLQNLNHHHQRLVWQEAACEAGKNVRHPDHQHPIPPRPHPLPSAVHQQLRLQQSVHQAPEVCGWQHSFLCRGSTFTKALPHVGYWRLKMFTTWHVSVDGIAMVDT